MNAPYWLRKSDSEFPPVDLALREPDGLLAVGGDLSIPRLLNAYAHGIFPWYSEGQPILWWSPDPRLVLYPANVTIHRSLAKTLRRNIFNIRFDTAFTKVIEACAAPRRDADGTWISTEIQQAYRRLHDAGYAHSIECWQDDELVGGLYGIALGRVFFGESMFSLTANASKVALVYLCAHLAAWGFTIIDCQVATPHLRSLGAVTIPRQEFINSLAGHVDLTETTAIWRVEENLQRQLVTSGKLAPLLVD